MRQLDLRKSVVTIDAMGTQTDIADVIIAGRGDYCLAVKGNQGNLHEDIDLYFSDAKLLSKLTEKGNSSDNGMMESFFGILKSEMFYGYEKSF